MDAIVFYILMPAILMLFFIHFNFKRIKLLTTINEYLLFKKYLFNRKINVAISKKTACSFFYFFSITVIIAPSFCIWHLVEWDIWEDMFSFRVLLTVIFFLVLLLLIIRLLYEFLIIPYLYKRSTQNTYQENVPYTNAAYKNDNMTMNFKFCSQCGTRYPKNDSVCPKCGQN